MAALLLMLVSVSPAFSATMESITNSTVSAGDRQDDPRPEQDQKSSTSF
jgi:hypothetical protein